MYDTYDLGGTPANEPCAQLGHTEDFSRINRLEVENTAPRSRPGSARHPKAARSSC